MGYDGLEEYCLQKDIKALEEFNTVKIYLEKKFGGKRIYELDMGKSDLNNSIDNVKSKKHPQFCGCFYMFMFSSLYFNISL